MIETIRAEQSYEPLYELAIAASLTVQDRRNRGRRKEESRIVRDAVGLVSLVRLYLITCINPHVARWLTACLVSWL
jgi:hypothetical protein